MDLRGRGLMSHEIPGSGPSLEFCSTAAIADQRVLLA
jgi:hypothetical protein